MLNEIFRVYITKFEKDEPKQVLAGRFYIHDNSLSILEDYFGLIENYVTPGPVTEQINHKINVMKHSSYLNVVTEQEVQDGNHPELIPEDSHLIEDAFNYTKDDPTPADDLIEEYHYHPNGLNEPLKVQIQGESASINGHALSPAELEEMFQKVTNNEASLRSTSDIHDE